MAGENGREDRREGCHIDQEAVEKRLYETGERWETIAKKIGYATVHGMRQALKRERMSRSCYALMCQVYGMDPEQYLKKEPERAPEGVTDPAGEPMVTAIYKVLASIDRTLLDLSLTVKRLEGLEQANKTNIMSINAQVYETTKGVNALVKGLTE